MSQGYAVLLVGCAREACGFICAHIYLLFAVYNKNAYISCYCRGERIRIGINICYKSSEFCLYIVFLLQIFLADNLPDAKDCGDLWLSRGEPVGPLKQFYPGGVSGASIRLDRP